MAKFEIADVPASFKSGVWFPQLMKSEGGGEISYLGHKSKLTHNSAVVLVVFGEICFHKEMKMVFFLLQKHEKAQR